MISPAETVAAIARHLPAALEIPPLEASPPLTVATDLAEIIGSNPDLLLEPARFLAEDRQSIHATAATANALISHAIGDIISCGQRYLADATHLVSLAVSPGASIPAMIRLHQRSHEALGEVQSRLDELQRELAPQTVKLTQLATDAHTRRISAPGPAALHASDELHALAAEESAEPIPVSEPSSGASNRAGEAAVAAAKTQLGTPYVWGGTQPGGFDCSGLTSWAYAQAGVELPRIAEQQAIGTQVSFDQLQPGDLAVWDGHVAMYAGEGKYIEAGDPVQLNPVRTDNIGMAFKGFWRPTA